MIDASSAYLAKARRSLAAAERELAAGAHDDAVSRAYYACFQAAVAALLRAGVRPRGDGWGHDFVQAELARRRLVRADLRSTLPRTIGLRHTADYDAESVSRRQARDAVERARVFVAALEPAGGAR